MIKQLLSISLFFVLLFSLSCKGPEGEVGPKGDTGAQGPPGESGPASNSGGGGAYVILMEGNVQTDSLGNIEFGSDDFFEGFSNDDIMSIEKGSIQVFLKESGAYFPIPGPVIFSEENDIVSYTFLYAVLGKAFGISILKTSSTQKPIRKFDEVRVLIIPAMIAGARIGVNWSNYEEAVKALGLTEKDVKRLK